MTESTAPKHQWTLPENQGISIDGDQTGGYSSILSVDQAERMVEKIETFSLQDVGSSKFTLLFL